MIIKTIFKHIGKLFSRLAFGLLVSLMASSLIDIHYFFVRLKYTSGLDSLKSWMISGVVIGVLGGTIFVAKTLKQTSSPKNLELVSLLLLRFLIASSSIVVMTLMVWNYYKFDYFRLKDAGPIGLTVGAILALWELSANISAYVNKPAN